MLKREVTLDCRKLSPGEKHVDYVQRSHMTLVTCSHMIFSVYILIFSFVKAAGDLISI